MVQASHAALTLSSRVHEVGIPNIVLIGVPTKSSLLRVEKKLIDHAIDHVAWEEPDYDFGLTALATVPLTREQKKPLANYCVWQPIGRCSLTKAPDNNPEMGIRNTTAAPIFPCSLTKTPAGFATGGETAVRTSPGEPIST